MAVDVGREVYTLFRVHSGALVRGGTSRMGDFARGPAGGI